jgi:hypothetical protein
LTFLRRDVETLGPLSRRISLFEFLELLEFLIPPAFQGAGLDRLIVL